MSNKDPERLLAKQARFAGFTRAGYLNLRHRAVVRQAIAEKWSKEKLDQAHEAIENLADEVWGPLS